MSLFLASSAAALLAASMVSVGTVRVTEAAAMRRLRRFVAREIYRHLMSTNTPNTKGSTRARS
ncbi:hypothetical protein QC281_34730 [Streptomyces sp. DH17]|nr:hypothetical protein [Streptomyces sp. DH17]